MSEETLKRIEKDSHNYCEGWGESCDLKSYRAGAISERNKVLEHIQAQMELYRTENHGYNGQMMYIKDVISYLESLKLPTK